MFTPFINPNDLWQHLVLSKDQYCEEKATALNQLAESIHAQNVVAGWWHIPKTGLRKDRNVGELLALVHSEISEALEGERKGAMDSHLPHFSSLTVELADAIIRILDMAGAARVPIGHALFQKLAYNRNRDDHKPENRVLPGGKAF